jgi:ATP-dependent DNA helicase PIF1
MSRKRTRFDPSDLDAIFATKCAKSPPPSSFKPKAPKLSRPALQPSHSINTTHQNPSTSLFSKPIKPNHASTVDSYSLSAKQASIVQLARAGKNVFFTGPAGSGKSVVLKALKCELDPASTFFLAPTGAAALEIRGSTIHAFAGITPGLDLASTAPRTNARWAAVKCLVLDEISMVDAALFEWLEAAARVIKQNDAVWGGLQVVVTGDFAQLPPVAPQNAAAGPGFAFESGAWKATGFTTVLLDQVFRQRSDAAFLSMLHELRFGLCSLETTRQLRSRLKSTLALDDQRAPSPINGDGKLLKIMPTILYPHRKDVSAENDRRLSELTTPLMCFDAQDYAPDARQLTSLDGSCPAPKQLKLKEGAQVILLVNLDTERGLVNGSRGVVTRFAPNAAGLMCPIVRFAASGNEVLVQRHVWKVGESGSTLLGRGSAQRTQIPLALAYAMSIHRSQGMTIDAVELSLGHSFEVGMAYVALSRVRSLDSLVLLDFHPSAVRADRRVVEFYRDLQYVESHQLPSFDTCTDG